MKKVSKSGKSKHKSFFMWMVFGLILLLSLSVIFCLVSGVGSQSKYHDGWLMVG